ncbi:MAG: hypothetical protein J0I20_15680 [Chloroflexi bacterium]|nr:hypothetical protein [Chloroflexota bacterium]
MFIALIGFMAVVMAFSLILTITTMETRAETAEVIVFLDKTVEVRAH